MSRRKNKSFLLLFTLIVVCVKEIASAISNIDQISCKDDRGQNVDWFYAYKLPKHYTGNAINSDSSGLQYMFVTSEEVDAWQMSEYKLNESNSMLPQTLIPLFSDPTVLLLAYNDEFPNGTTIMTGGHTKGVVATNGKSGIWLIHSVPKFPSIPEYEYPSTGERYGQSFLCLTLSATEINNIGTQLMFNEPNIYYSRVPVMLNNRFPTLESVIAGEKRKKAPFHNLLDISTLAGQQFKTFAKGTHFEKELYEDLVAPELDVNLLVESWRNGAGNLPSNCTNSDKIFNIIGIDEKKLQLSFKTTSDHSKWAVSQATGFKIWRWTIGGGSSNWICVGDINRQQTQRHRGGGTVCQKNTKLAKLYRNMISSYEACGNA